MSRLSKRWKVGLISVACLALMVATVPLAIWVTHTSSAQLANDRARCFTATEAKASVTHRVVIQAGRVSPDHTAAKLCDKLTIINQDAQERLMAFGPHAHHVSYDGVSERLLSQGQSLTITLIRAGTFTFHDHSDEVVKGSFTVTPASLTAK